MLEEYSWPQNINQLQRVLNEAMLLTNSPWITAKSIRQILSEARFLCGRLRDGSGTQINIE